MTIPEYAEMLTAKRYKEIQEEIEKLEEEMKTKDKEHQKEIKAKNKEHQKEIKAKNKEHQKEIKAKDKEHQKEIKAKDEEIKESNDKLKKIKEIVKNFPDGGDKKAMAAINSILLNE